MPPFAARVAAESVAAEVQRVATRHRWVLAAYTALGLALWPVPLLGLVHVEAAAVVACVAFFASGGAALAAFQKKEGEAATFGRVLMRQEALLLVPLLLLTATLLWRPNCDYARGLLLYLVMPPVTVAFAVGLAYALVGLGVRHAWATLVLVGLGVGLGGALYDLGFHPQFYTYNHLFGGVLGPIYDRELALRPGFFAFRALTLAWALLFFLAGRWGRLRQESRAGGPRGNARWVCVATALATAALIGGAYLNAARLGFNTPAWHLQQELGGHLRTAHFDLYYDPGSVSEEELARLAEDHEWHYHWLKERLGVAPSERIASYLYPDEEAKARLTGARRTSVAPVWLGRPQVHLLRRAYARSFGHELVHAFSREFGLPLINASRSVGLVEGLAVAFEPPRGRPSPADQVSAAALLEVGDPEEISLAEGVAARLSPLGFWTGRAAVGYTTMGAFVRFLAARYGPEKLRAVYAWANFEDVYGKPVRALAEEWEEALMRRRAVARAAGALAEARFSRPSLFEVACPHYVPPHRRAYRQGREALAGGDTTAALRAFRHALDEEPAFEAARVAAARLLLAQSVPRDAPAATAPAADTSAAALRVLRLLQAAPEEDSAAHGSAFYVARADAQGLQGRAAAALGSYERALERLPLYRHETRVLVGLRRALAGRPRFLGAIVGAGAPLEKARRLGALATDRLSPSARTAALVWRAWLLAQGGRFARATQLLGQALPLDEPPPGASSGQPAAARALQRQRLAWLAQWQYRAGHARRAEGYARRAAQAYRQVGDRDAAARWATFAAKMQWVAASPRRAAPLR